MKEEEHIMKSTGIVRKVDELGRVVIPVELRRVLGIEERDSLEIYMDGDKVILKKYVSSEINIEKEAAVSELEALAMSAEDKEVEDVLNNAIRLLRQK